MEAKDKMIGAILIIVGLFFIGMGAYVMMKTNNSNVQNNVYQEQQIENTNINEETEQKTINIYSENQTENKDTEDQTRYIY